MLLVVPLTIARRRLWRTDLDLVEQNGKNVLFCSSPFFEPYAFLSKSTFTVTTSTINRSTPAKWSRFLLLLVDFLLFLLDGFHYCPLPFSCSQGVVPCAYQERPLLG